MRTTIRLDGDLLRAAKRRALETGRTLTAVIDEALRESMARPAGGASRGRYRIVPYRGGGLLPGVNLDDSSALLDLMESSDVSP